jgi:hypothetical protein
MNKSQASTFYLPLSLAISTAGLALTIFMVLQPNPEHVQTLLQRSPIGALYCILCLLGISAVFYPAKCKGLFKPIQERPAEAKTHSTPLQTKGHHPDCQNFSGNRIKVGERIFCAACTGLLIGAIVALVGTIFYFFGVLSIAWGSIWIVGLGEILMFAGLFQIKFAGRAKAMLNAVFVIGSFLTLVEVDAIGKSVVVDLYVFGLISFLLWLRISLSEWNNRRTCFRCQSCFY